MSVAGISSTSLFNAPSASSTQNQQQQWLQQVQSLAQELQANNLTIGQSAAQTQAQTALAALQPQGSPISTTSSPSGNPIAQVFSAPQANPTPGSHAHFHHRFRVGADQDSAAEDSDQSSQSPSASPTTAQQAYSTWQHDLQQIALNSDLLSAQSVSLTA